MYKTNYRMVYKTVGILIFVLVIIGNIAMTPSKAQQSKTTQNWHIPDLANSPANVEIKADYTEVTDTIPIRGTKYMIRVPNNWNGTLISDLDYLPSANSERNLYLLENGYALSGTKRRSERLFHYDPAHEIHDIISVLDIFETLFGKPERTIQLGCSGGGTITLAMAEIHPDRIDGAIATCGATSPWMANTHMDALFVLKALIAPELPIVDLPLNGDELKKLEIKWQDAIKQAQETTEGRARITLAFTIGQWPAWGGPGKSTGKEPDPNNSKELQESMYLSLLKLLPSNGTFGTGMLEQAGKGQLRWNTGIDYVKFYDNGNQAYKKAVEQLYKTAGLNLKKDLKTINDFERVESDPKAIKYWSVPGRTHLGEPKVPLLRITTSGDGLVYPSMAQGYGELVEEKGYGDLFRITYVRSWGHCTFNLAEWIAAIKTMEQRIKNGSWPNTNSQTLNKLGESLIPSQTARYFEHLPVTKYNRTWCPTPTDFIGN